MNIVNEAKLIELLNDELDILINKAHRSGLNYWHIFKILLNKCLALMMMSEAEYYQKGG